MFLRNSGMHIIYELRILADNRLSWLMHAMPTWASYSDSHEESKEGESLDDTIDKIGTIVGLRTLGTLSIRCDITSKLVTLDYG